MKDYKPRYEELQKCYQTWLTDFTKLTVRQGMCHQGNGPNLLIVFYVQIMPDDFIMQLHRF